MRPWIFQPRPKNQKQPRNRKLYMLCKLQDPLLISKTKTKKTDSITEVLVCLQNWGQEASCLNFQSHQNIIIMKPNQKLIPNWITKITITLKTKKIALKLYKFHWKLTPQKTKLRSFTTRSIQIQLGWCPETQRKRESVCKREEIERESKRFKSKHQKRGNWRGTVEWEWEKEQWFWSRTHTVTDTNEGSVIVFIHS